VDQGEVDSLNAMKPTPLPNPLSTIVVPDEFHPSSFAQLERCPLSVLGPLAVDQKDLLVAHPAAYLGQILHHARHEVIEGRWGTAQDPRQAASEIFAGAVDEAEGALSSHPATEGLVPLRESVGRRAWKSRTRDFERWAAGVAVGGRNEPPRRLILQSWGTSNARAGFDQAHTGSEQTLAIRPLRLRGRPDWTAHIDDARIEVVDFKSGRITDIDGQLLDEQVVQVQLYALMLEASFPEAEVRPFIERVERVAVPWGDEERTRVIARLKEASTGLPAGATLKAIELARPGVHCGGCRLRPMCAAYLSTALSWWPDERGNPRPLPLDVWGEVTSVEPQGDDVGVRLADAAGRRVRVDGIDRLHGVAEMKRGDRAWFFDLQASEDLSQHGALVHPRNFHEHAPGHRWRRARTARVFSAP
jgi:CRISPR/Cas system-associated exonuclease Cas4 (RecB family)